MKHIFILILSFFCFSQSFAQDSIIKFSNKNFSSRGSLNLYEKNGWFFRSGNDSAWANKNIDMQQWKQLLPQNLDNSYADANGKLEGWFRCKFTLDSSLMNTNWRFMYQPYAAGKVYLDGQLIGEYGSMGANNQDFKFYTEADPTQGVEISVGLVHTLAVHIKDEVVFPSNRTSMMIGGKTGGVKKDFIYIIPLERWFSRLTVKTDLLVYYSLWIGINGLFTFLFLLLFLLNKKENNLLLYAGICLTLTSIFGFGLLSGLAENFNFHPRTLLFVSTASDFSFLLLKLLIGILIFKIFNIEKKGFNWILFRVIILIYILVFAVELLDIFNIQFVNVVDSADNLSFIVLLVSTFYWIVISFKKASTPPRVVSVGIVLMIILILIISLADIDPSSYTNYNLATAISLCFPFTLIAYVALRFREINKNIILNAQQIVALSDEKRTMAENQQKQLEFQVKERTIELENSIDKLKSTQSQLIQSEKMASLGELTAGIAHEIQNPLNFVNNFSEVNTELIDEVGEEINNGNISEAKIILNDIKDNSEKINHHGKRAGDIVKGMLQHSRSSNGVKEPTDINALADEYLRLAYHGLRAKDKNFNSTMKTDYDESIGKINIIPQDIGRVILNLITNAFYVVNEKAKAMTSALTQQSDGFEPTVWVSTKMVVDKVEIKVSDNGGGIPQKILDKIFQPFFTTKPTGQGTGLGLSLSYDIVKTHGGELKVETSEGEGTTFFISLPVNN